ncbi:MAG: hypothetical protein ABIJ84_00050 [bacterium]
MREGEPHLEENFPIEEAKNETSFTEDATEFQLDLLKHEPPLTIEEITKIRSNEYQLPNRPSLQRRDYKLSGAEISVINQRIYTDDPAFRKNKEKIIDMVESKEEGEVYPYERVIVNALFEQTRIAKAFDIPTDSSFKLDYTSRETIIMDNHGFIYLLGLREQINLLKKHGANEQRVITEISGHMFHEALHMCEDMESGFLQGRRPVGEFTSITGQLAYSILKGYNAPLSYDNNTLREGNKKIKDGEDSSRDYDVATCAAAELLLEKLSVTYPEIAKDVEAKTSLDACEAIVAKIPVERRDVLIPCLKEAILQSTDKDKFREVVGRLKKEK